MTRSAALALLAGAGCTCGIPATSSLTFSCQADSDCTSPEVCLNGTCAPATSGGDCDGGCWNAACAGRACAFSFQNMNQGCCNNVCRDLSTDPQNCGVCGIGCASGTCRGSQCSCTTATECPSGHGFQDGGDKFQLCTAGACTCTSDHQCPTDGCDTTHGVCQPGGG